MSEFAQSVFLSSCPTDNSDGLNRLMLGSNMKQNFINSHMKPANNTEDLQRVNQGLQQKILLLEREREEMLERESNLKKINDQIMEAFNSVGLDSTSNINKEIKILEDKHGKEMQLLRDKIENAMIQLEQERKSFAQKFSLQDNDIQSQKIHCEHLKTELQKQQHLLHLQQNQYDTIIKSLESDKRYLQEEIESQWKRKIDVLERQLEKEKNEYSLSHEQMLKETETNLENLRICHEHEKHLLWTKINSLKNEKNVVTDSCEQNIELYNELKTRHKEDRENYMQEIDILKRKINNLEQENLKISHYEMLQSQHENQLKQKELAFDEERKKYNYKLKEISLQLKKAEQIEKNLQVLIKEKDFIIEDNKKEHSKRLNLEKKKSENLQEAANKIKEDYTKKNAFVIQEILTKEEHIKKLNKEILKQGVSMSKLNLSKTNMTTWFDPTLQIDTGRLNSQSNVQNLTTILNQDTIPDMNLLSNNVPHITNNNTFLQEFALSFGSPRNLLAHSPQQIDDKYFKIIEQQKQNWQQSIQYNEKGVAKYSQNNLLKQQSSPLLSETVESINCSSPQLIPQKDMSRLNLMSKPDKIQETQNESEDNSFNQYDYMDGIEEEAQLVQKNNILAQSLFNSKHPSMGFVGQTVNNSSIQYINSQSAINTAPNSHRQALSHNNTNNCSISCLDSKLQNQQNSNNNNNKTLSQNNSKSKFTPQTQSQRCSTVTTTKKKQMQNKTLNQENERSTTPNTSTTNLKERKSTNNSTISSKTPGLSTYKKSTHSSRQQLQQQQMLSPASSNNNNNSNIYQSNLNNYFVTPGQNTQDSQDPLKRNFSQSQHQTSQINNLSSQTVPNTNRNKPINSLHRNSNSNLDFKRDHSSNQIDNNSSKCQNSSSNIQSMNKQTFSQNCQSAIDISTLGCAANIEVPSSQKQLEQRTSTIPSKQLLYTDIEGLQKNEGQQQLCHLLKNNSYQVSQIIGDKTHNNSKNISSDTLYSYQYNSNPLQSAAHSQIPQSGNISASEQKPILPLQVSNCNMVESTLLSASKNAFVKNPMTPSSSQSIPLRYSNMIKQVELYQHVNNLIETLQKKQRESPECNSLSVQELNFLLRQVQQQAEEFQSEELNSINKFIQQNNVNNMISCFEKIRNRLVDKQATTQKLSSPFVYKPYGGDYTYSNKKQEGNDVFERLYKNVQNQINVQHQQLHTETSEICQSLHTLPNETENSTVNVVRVSDVMKTNVRQSINLNNNQSLNQINSTSSSNPYNQNMPFNNKTNLPIVRNITLN